MYYEFYIDQFVLEHLFTGFLLFRLTAKIGKMTVSAKRAAGGSMINTVLMLWAVLAGKPWWYFSGLLFSGLFVFGWNSRRILAKRMLLLLMVTFFFGGTLEALVELFPLPVMFLEMGAAGITAWGAVRRKREIQGARLSLPQEQSAVLIRELQRTVSVQLTCCKKTVTVRALIDTGNQLTEPLTGQPVSIVEEKAVADLLEGYREEEYGFYLIPYHSLGKDKGWMRGIKIDRMTVEKDGKLSVITKPLLGFYRGEVSSQKRYCMILHPQHAVSEKGIGGS